MPQKKDELKEFLKNNRISDEDWQKAKIEFETLQEIAHAHTNNLRNLNEAAEFLARLLQQNENVHSVRWRVKSVEHLMEKIVRKRKDDNEKYKNIDASNYSDIVTDLVGVRVLHLFKHEWQEIHKYITETWEEVEKVTAYIRKGDQGAEIQCYENNNCEVKDHPAGYRSIHYVISTQPTKNKVFCEIQVRTIFEEGWSEIDHKIRYPNFSDNQLISYFLTIFNRLAGSADEMGSFVRDLTDEIKMYEHQLEQTNHEKETEINKLQTEQEQHIQKIEELVRQLSTAKHVNQTKDGQLQKLQSELLKLKTNYQTTSDWARKQLATTKPESRTVILGDALNNWKRKGLMK